MKKVRILSILLLIFYSAALFGAANKIELTATIGSKALVGFNDMSSSTAKGLIFVDDSLNSLDFGTQSAGEIHAAITRPIYISTNNNSGINMTLQDSSNGGDLVHTSGDSIKMNYIFDGEPITIWTPFQIASGINNGSIPVGNMEFQPKRTSIDNSTGSYSTTLSVIISAN